MPLKRYLSIIFLLISINCSAQKIDDIGDGWKATVEKALAVIKKYDSTKYNFIKANCTKISYWLGSFATIEQPRTILIPTTEMNKACINDIACVIVHESLHLYYRYPETEMVLEREEFFAYSYEYDFLKHLPHPETWLIDHVENMILKYSK